MHKNANLGIFEVSMFAIAFGCCCCAVKSEAPYEVSRKAENGPCSKLTGGAGFLEWMFSAMAVA